MAKPKFTAEVRAEFLKLLARGVNVRAACRAVGIDPVTAHRHRRERIKFRRAWERALARAEERERRAWRLPQRKEIREIDKLLKDIEGMVAEMTAAADEA